MNKHPVSHLALLAALLFVSGSTQGQKLTVADLVNLKEMGFTTQDIQAEIDASGVESIGAEDLQLLRDKGLDAALTDTLGTLPAETSTASDLQAATGMPTPAPTAETAPNEPAADEPTEAAATDAATAQSAPAPTAADTGDTAQVNAGNDEFVQPALPSAPEMPEPPPVPVGPGTLPHPAPAPMPAPAPQIVQPAVPAPMPMPAATVYGTTQHRMEAGKTAAFNLPYNNGSARPVTVTAVVVGDQWLSVSPAQSNANPGGSVNFNVRLSSVGLNPGAYQARVRLSGGDIAIEYPFALTVTPAAMPGPSLVSPMPGPAPKPAPVPVPTPVPYQGGIPGPSPGPAGYDAPWGGQESPAQPHRQPGYGQASELAGDWAAVVPGAWGMQTILYLEIAADGSFGYSVLQNNQIVEYTSGILSGSGGTLQVNTSEGEFLSYGYGRLGSQLIINMPEWGGNVAFYPQ